MALKIKYEDLEHGGFDFGGSEILLYQGKPFTGICQIYEDEGWLSGENEYQNGYLEGWVRDYYENGQLETEYKLHNNNHVPNTYKAFDENGNLIS